MKKEETKKSKIDWKIFISSAVIVFLSALIGSFLTSKSVKTEWYTSIKPSITPPNWVFPIVWTFLFCLIAISLYLSLTSTKKKEVQLKIYTLFGFNLILNVLWSFFYFYLRNPAMAYFDLIVLLASIAMLISFIRKINMKAALLLVPYFLWVCFAGVLNYLSAFV
jgi:benzodiazapine receptor